MYYNCKFNSSLFQLSQLAPLSEVQASGQQHDYEHNCTQLFCNDIT